MLQENVNSIQFETEIQGIIRSQIQTTQRLLLIKFSNITFVLKILKSLKEGSLQYKNYYQNMKGVCQKRQIKQNEPQKNSIKKRRSKKANSVLKESKANEHDRQDKLIEYKQLMKSSKNYLWTEQMEEELMKKYHQTHSVAKCRKYLLQIYRELLIEDQQGFWVRREIVYRLDKIFRSLINKLKKISKNSSVQPKIVKLSDNQIRLVMKGSIAVNVRVKLCKIYLQYKNTAIPLSEVVDVIKDINVIFSAQSKKYKYDFK